MFENKKEEITQLITDENPDIVCFTELINKREGSIEPITLKINGYEKFFGINPKRGVIIYVKECYNAINFTEFEIQDFEESVWCTFNTDNKESILIGNIYHSPNSSKDNTDKLYKLLE